MYFDTWRNNRHDQLACERKDNMTNLIIWPGTVYFYLNPSDISPLLSMTSSPDVTKHSTISMLKCHRKSHRRTKGRVERRQFADSLTFTHLGLDKWSPFWTLHSKSILLNENCCIWFKFNWTQKVHNSFQDSYYLPKRYCAIVNIWCAYICRFCFFM